MNIQPTVNKLEWIYALFIIIGFSTNAVIVAVTVKSRKLRSSCNLLIALCCGMDAVHALGHSPSVYAALTGNLFINVRTCYMLEVVPVACCLGGAVGILSIGIDRYTACFFPHWYSTKSKPRYMIAHVSCMIAYAAFILILGFFSLEDRDTFCHIPEAIRKPAASIWFLSELLLHLVSIVVYLLVFQKIKRSKLSEGHRAIFRTLLLDLCVSIGGWSLTTASVFVGQSIIGDDPEALIILHMIVGIPINIAVCSNLLIYYSTSTIYRQELRNLLTRSGNVHNAPRKRLEKRAKRQHTLTLDNYVTK